MNAWLPQASYPCGNFSDTSSLKSRRAKGSIGHDFKFRRYMLGAWEAPLPSVGRDGPALTAVTALAVR
ncbi:hypothetical protein J5N97_026119 [Dioscorea zingiberensis]|uniref:Senescence-associated protein n=1 Tax=Dioscorea zingiberensis TaxID=325984 RepID=A0A9D5H6E6_9LILI|nr:hypothetical protein J5N97_026119 [Dioscorea zingiberensis]